MSARWRRLRSWPLWSRVTALLLLASVVPLLLFGALILDRERTMARAANVALLEARVDEVGNTLEAMYRGYRDAAARATRDPEIAAFCAAAPEVRARALPSVRQHLEAFRGDDAALRGLVIVDRHGKIVAATDGALLGIDVSHREYFRRARAGAEIVSSVFLGPAATEHAPFVAFAAPVRSGGDEVIGVYVLLLRAQALWDVMRSVNGTAGRGSFFALFDGHGVRVGDSADEKLLFHPSAPLPEGAARAMLAERRFQERTEALLDAVVPFPLHEPHGRERRVFRRTSSPTGEEAFLVVARHFPGLGGTLVGHLPERELDVGIATLLPRVLPAFLVGLLLVAFGGALLMRHVVGPIRDLAAAARALERGDLALERTPGGDAASGDEIGALERAFGSMAHTLAVRNRALFERNRELERHQRGLLTLSGCNEALVRATDEQSLLQAVCDIVVRVGGYRMCWVGAAQHDERRSVMPVAHAGHEAGYLAKADVVWADTDRGRGPVGTAIRTRASVITRNILSDGAFAPWAGEASARGYRSVAALPMAADGAVLGALAIYAHEEAAFDAEEMKLLGELADDLAYGITALRGRTERLAMTARLLESDRMAAMGTLAAGIAHEINNPLAYVTAALRFLEDDLGALEDDRAGRLGDMKAALSDANDGARRIAAVVRSVKTFSRAGDAPSGPVDLHAVLDAAIRIAHGELKQRAQLVQEYGPVPRVVGSDARLGQVFLNLLMNAAQAIPAGCAEENEIRITTRTDDAGRAVVEVRDTGRGVPPDAAPRLFDPFFTTKPAGVGTGLGLFICRTIVSAAGGEISFEGPPGGGTIFRVALPASPAPAEAGLSRVAPANEAPPGRRGRVLVVDDEPAVGAVVRRVLREHHVTVLTSARDARDMIFRGDEFDAIVCDLMMPEMSGMDLHAEVAAAAPGQAARMIMLTGGAFTATAQAFLERCPSPCLDKPIDADELRATVRLLVG